MRQNTWAKWFGGVLLLIFAGLTLAWPVSTPAQSYVSPFSGMRPVVSILTPTDGVNFKTYINYLSATMQRNWFAVMPESALMGEKGFVVLKFHIQRDGKIPDSDPTLEHSSNSEELDDAAMKAVRVTARFEPLPEAFHGPNIRVRFIFFYNAPVPGGPARPSDCDNNAPRDRSEPHLVPLVHPPPAARLCYVN
jgi:TonB family protein